MRLRTTAAALGCAVAVVLAGCSGTAPLSTSPTTSPAAPGAGSSHAGSASAAASESSSEELDRLAETAPAPDATGTRVATSTLPGLSAGCTAVIRAQASVNKLFAAAIAVPTGTTPATTGTVPQSTEGAAPATGPSPAGTATSPARAITTADIASAFAGVDAAVPPAVARQFAVLKKAATDVVGKSPAAVADALTSKDATAAMAGITTYIGHCSPPTTSAG